MSGLEATGLSLILSHFPNLSEQQRAQFEALGELYATWNARINVISRKDMDQFYVRHVLHSLGIAKVMDFHPGSRVMDVGTGGGFPGIPLAILFPESSFYLIDSIGKKVRVVREVKEELGLRNVLAEQIRAEQVKESFDFVVSRAVTRMPDFLSWIEKQVKPGNESRLPNGVLYLKGGDLTAELGPVARPIRMFDLADHFPDPFFETKKVVYVDLTS